MRRNMQVQGLWKTFLEGEPIEASVGNYEGFYKLRGDQCGWGVTSKRRDGSRVRLRPCLKSCAGCGKEHVTDL